MNLTSVPQEQLYQWLGAASLVLSFASFWRGAGAASRVEAIEETPTSLAATIHQAGYYEVKGRVVCDDPVPLPDSDRPVVYYRRRVWERYEEEYRDKNGYPQVRQVEDLLSDECEYADFLVEDESGRIAVNPRGAQIDADVVLDEIREAPPGTHPGGSGGGPRGASVRRHQIIAIPVGNDLYVLGPTRIPSSGGPMLFHADKREDRPFILSVRSEEEQTAQHRAQANLLNLGGLIFGILGAVLLASARRVF